QDAGAADEVQALEMVGPVEPVAAWAPSGSGQQAHPLVVADGLDVGARVLRQPADGDPTGPVHVFPLPEIALESGVTTDSIVVLADTSRGAADAERQDQDCRRAW